MSRGRDGLGPKCPVTKVSGTCLCIGGKGDSMLSLNNIYLYK